MAFVATLLGAHHIPVSPAEQTDIVGGVMAAMMIALRCITSQPITFTTPPTPPARTVANVVGVALLLLLLPLAACTPTSSAPALSTTSAVTSAASVEQKIQGDWPVLRAALSFYASSPGSNAAADAVILKAEGPIDAEIAALSSLSSPASVRAVVNDISALVAALPTSALSPQDKAGIALLIALANALLPATPVAAVPSS